MPKLFSKLTVTDEAEEATVTDQSTENGATGDNANLEASQDEEWLSGEAEEGQLSVDVFQTPTEVVIKSTIAGVKPDDIDIDINNDMITIRGERREDVEVEEDDYFYQECYWGSFSRSIILPVEVLAEEAKAALKNGVLTIRLPKSKKSKSVAVKVQAD